MQIRLDQNFFQWNSQEVVEFDLYEEEEEVSWLFVPCDSFEKVFHRPATMLEAGQVQFSDRLINGVMKKGIYVQWMSAEQRECPVVKYKHRQGFLCNSFMLEKDHTSAKGLGTKPRTSSALA